MYTCMYLYIAYAILILIKDFGIEYADHCYMYCMYCMYNFMIMAP